MTPPGAPVLYAALGGVSSTSDLYTVDPVTAVMTSIGAIGFAMTGLAFRPSDGVLFGVTSSGSGSDPRSLITIDPVTGAGTLVGATGLSQGPTDIAFLSDDSAYGYNPNNRCLYSIDTSTGAATQVSANAIPAGGTSGFAVSVDSADQLFCFPKRAAGAFYIVDPVTGIPTAQTALTGTGADAGASINAATFDENDLCWVITYDFGTDWYLAAIDVAISDITNVALTTDQADALAWSLP